ncbi:MAG: hypothetical protein HY707_07920 [Ignavibacteriae bacterium]|nr:hypothetical protein [Ignavibacteriota bacterium]
MKSDSRKDKWERWLNIIQNDLYELLMLRYVFLEVQKIIKANRKIQTDGYFYDWVAITYSKTASVCVRRQLDTDSRTITLGRLLSEIQRTPAILSLSRFESMYTQGLSTRTEEQRIFYNLEKRRAKKEFQQFSGKVKMHVDPSLVSNDLILLNRACRPIVKYVNKRVAHRDKKQFTTLPTFNDLDTAIDALYDMFKKYMLLLPCVQFDFVIQPQWDWKEIFKVAWIE